MQPSKQRATKHFKIGSGGCSKLQTDKKARVNSSKKMKSIRKGMMGYKNQL
jgi:hypothetical protein